MRRFSGLRRVELGAPSSVTMAGVGGASKRPRGLRKTGWLRGRRGRLSLGVALGAGYPETRNKNRSGLHWDMVCDLRKGGEIYADGELIQKNGRFLNKRFPQP